MRLIAAIAAFLALVTAGAPAVAEELTLICKGDARVGHENPTGMGRTFQVTIDTEKGTAVLDNKPVKRVTISEDEVAMLFPANAAGRALLGIATMGMSELSRSGTLVEDRSLTIDRRTGLYRETDGSGACEKRDLSKRLF